MGNMFTTHFLFYWFNNYKVVLSAPCSLCVELKYKKINKAVGLLNNKLHNSMIHFSLHLPVGSHTHVHTDGGAAMPLSMWSLCCK